MDHKMIFDLFKNIIIKQNEVLIKEIAKVSELDEKYLIEKYIKPAYYLPIISKQLS
jgi:hypothetical protein